MDKKDKKKPSPFDSREFVYIETNLDVFLYPHRSDMGFALLCTSGEALISIGVLENKITVNTELIVLPGSSVSLIHASEDFNSRAFLFSMELLENTSLRLGNVLFLFLRDIPSFLHTEDSQLLRNLIIIMDNAELVSNENNNEFIELMQFNFLQNYFIYLFDKCQNHFSYLFNAHTHKRSLFYQFLSLVDQYYETKRNVSFYADKLSITPRYLRKITIDNGNFKSPKEIIDKRIIIEIETLLYKTDLSLQEIADRLNFPDQSYLSRYFKMHKDCSPSFYKSQIKVLK